LAVQILAQKEKCLQQLFFFRFDINQWNGLDHETETDWNGTDKWTCWIG
jgi:hypothetical protein